MRPVLFVIALAGGLVTICLAQSTLPGTAALAGQEDLADKLMDGAHHFIERKIDESIRSRERHWRRDFDTPAAYAVSVQGNRARFQQKIGVVDTLLPGSMERFSDEANPALAGESASYE